MCQDQQLEDQLEVLVVQPLEELLILKQVQAPTLEQLEALLILEWMPRSSVTGYQPYFRCQECADPQLTGPTTFEPKRTLEYHSEQLELPVEAILWHPLPS